MSNPREITVWMCPKCDYWRQEKTTGVHQMSNPADPNGRMLVHALVHATFVCADFPDVTVAAAERLELLLRDDLLDDDEASDAVRLVLAAGWRPLADPNWCKRLEAAARVVVDEWHAENPFVGVSIEVLEDVLAEIDQRLPDPNWCKR